MPDTDPRPDEPPTVVGWREWVALPAMGVDWVKAKIDTGARTSSLHAFDQRVEDRDGEAWVRFSVHPWQSTDDDAVEICLPIADVREIRSSSGHAEQRYVVLTEMALAGRTVEVELTLSRRDDMGFRMLVGREALRQGFLVDPGESYRGGRPPRAQRRRNRGR
ncbi:MAG: ATP-dependent zinc protease [Nocardioides sp.]|uniref:ATP-dependent zinc protease family protein n=1 Tax=Nocardioides sp. TaxID=35761 RepID=UPI003F01DFEE